MKYKIQIFEITIIVLLIALSIVTYNQVRYSKNNKTSTNEIKTFHVAVISDHVNSYSAERFLRGITESVAANDCVYELYNLETFDLEELSKIIIATKIDGVIINLENNVQAAAFIRTLQENQIKVIAAGNDAPETNRDVYIGTNKYNLGKRAALLAIEATGNTGNVSVILGSEYEPEQLLSTNNFLNGIYETFQDLALFKLTSIKYSRSARAEIIIDELLRERPRINTVICTDPMDAIRVTRVLVDRNLVGDINIIASGDPPELIDAIQKELIYASVVEDYQELGILSMNNLIKILNGQGVSSYINIPIEVITKDDIVDESN